MQNIIDNSLNAELQELYLVNKQWLADLDFLETELAFLKKRFGESFAPLLKAQSKIKMEQLLATAEAIDQAHSLLKQDIHVFMKTIEGQLTKPTPDFDVRLIERHEQLIEQLSGLMQAYHLIKSKVFELAKHALKADPYLTIHSSFVPTV